ncbi:MAG: hypothetical protein RL376_73 [Verrucomicrobiota bacterium]|jgi:hypothetical protein
MPRFLRHLVLSVLVLLGATACSHYRLGTGVERPFETVFIPPVITQGQIPQAAAVFTTQLREAFIRDGRLQVVNTPEEADVVLEIKIGDYARRALTALPSDTGLARKMGLTLDLTATLRDTKGEKIWFADRPIRIERQIFTDDGSSAGPTFLQPVQQTQAEYQLVPQLAEAAAEKIKSAVLDTW